MSDFRRINKLKQQPKLIHGQKPAKIKNKNKKGIPNQKRRRSIEKRGKFSERKRRGPEIRVSGGERRRVRELTQKVTVEAWTGGEIYMYIYKDDSKFSWSSFLILNFFILIISLIFGVFLLVDA